MTITMIDQKITMMDQNVMLAVEKVYLRRGGGVSDIDENGAQVRVEPEVYEGFSSASVKRTLM